MNIGIKLDRDEFLYDLHSLVKSFYPDDEVSIFTENDEEKCSVPRDKLYEISIPAFTDRKAMKDRLKRELYERLKRETGKSLPWGTLSGIRPVKIPFHMLEEGCPEKDILSYMKETYYASDEKCALALQVAKTERALLKDLPIGPKSYSLYLHIPFCPSICLYCTFASNPVDAVRSRVDDYIRALVREMEEGYRILTENGMAKGPTTVYIGGGTPTALTPGQLDILMTETARIFDLSSAVEYTVEAGRPDSITEEALLVLKKHKVTRISVNPQTMNQRTLDIIGRAHTPEDTKKAFFLARDAGFSNINMDIILGLPGEEEAEVMETLSQIEELSPDSLTVHSLAIKRASRLKRTILEDREINADADYGNYCGYVFENSDALMALSAGSARRMGMEPYYLYRQKNMRGNLENTGFAKKGQACLYNILIMEEKESIAAFGAGASSKRILPDGSIERAVNPKNIDVYMQNTGSLLEKKRKLFRTL